jgi:penicillin-binding protein 1B
MASSKKSAKRRPIRDFLWRHSAGIAFVVMLLFIGAIGFVGYTYVIITKKFDSSRRWDLPSRIYSDSTPIFPGLQYSRALLEPKLNHVGYHAVTHEVSAPSEYRYEGETLEIFLQDFRYPEMTFHGMPVRLEFEGNTVRKITRMSDGVNLKAIRVEPELITSIYNDIMEDRIPVPLDQVPQNLIDAIVVTEDRNFFHHEGISIRGMIRAALTNFHSGGVRAGGSTLTQQLVKNLYLTPERNWSRKFHEIIMALILETRYTKQQILEAYLNEIYLGQNGAVQINGVEQASQVYFSKHVTYLTLPEAATVAGMIRWPGRYAPSRNPEASTDRRNLVLKMMLEQKKIDQATYERAVATPMTVNKFPKAINSAPFFVDLVLKQLRETYPETQLKTEGLQIFTTLDTMMQRSAEQALQSGIASLNKKYTHIAKSPTPLEGVVLTIQPGTGYVKALVGGRNYGRSQFNRALQARRQPGSLFKPFVYVAAMDPQKERPLTASSILDDSPITVQTGTQAWRPQNYDNRFHGEVTVRRALAFSYNIPAVRAAISAGVPNVIKLASSIGVSSKLEPYPSIALGSFEVTPLEVAYAYSVFANGGVKAEPISILAVSTSDGKLLESRQVKMQRVAPPGICYVMNNILQDVLEYGTAAKVRSLGFTRKYAGKTGTTNNYKDAWFVGYSPKLLSLVWLGYDDGHSVRLSGGEGAVPIWTSHMNRVVGMVPDTEFRRSDDVVDREIDPATGMLASPYCPSVETEVFVRGTEPNVVCTVHNAGTDELSPFWRSVPQVDGEPAMAQGGEPGQAPAAREPRRREKKSGLRKIFGWIFE